MRHIHVEDGLRVRFSGRSEEFDQGMAAGQRELTFTLASDTVDQARALAARMRYRVHIVHADDRWTEIMFLTGSRPKLSLVHSSRQVG